MKIGFDFDKVFVDYPPLIPDFLIDYLYKNHKSTKEFYRFPSSIEQKIRILSHYPVFRHPIKDNILILKKLSQNKENEIYLVSSRFSFLKMRTESWLRIHNLSKYFKGIYFNFDNLQPHIFKYHKIKELKLDYYIDDDIDLLKYLASKKIQTKLFWLNGKLFVTKDNVPSSITVVHNLSDIFTQIK